MKKVYLPIFILFTAVSFYSCKEDKKEETKPAEQVNATSQNEVYRPNFHFTPKEHWMNDPNGLVYYKGTYHLFFQYYPKASVWGPMHWGHAVSKNLFDWEQLPIALSPDEKGYIFSGSAVIDKQNTSGFGTVDNPPMVAIFTYHNAEAEKAGKKDYQSQAIAYSLDEGKNWNKYKGNPVIPNPGIENFRDPKVTRDTLHQQWLMALAAYDKTLFYSSKNLKEWKLLSEFGQDVGAHGGVWECPDFFPIKVENTNETKWVLIQSLNPGGYNGGSGTQYFLGDFDGVTFTLDKSMQNLEKNHSYWIDFGKDNYAGVTFANAPAPNDKKIFLGWMSNWLYGQEVPTTKWRSAMTTPREIILKKEGNTYRIFSNPVKGLEKFTSGIFKKQHLQVNGETKLTSGEKMDFTQAIISFKIGLDKSNAYVFNFSNKTGDTLSFGYRANQKEFFIDRSKSGLTDFSKDFANKASTAPRISTSDTLSVKMVLDKTSIELFFDKGETVMTEIFFPHTPYDTFSANGNYSYKIENLEMRQMNYLDASIRGIKFQIPNSKKEYDASRYVSRWGTSLQAGRLDPKRLNFDKPYEQQ